MGPTYTPPTPFAAWLKSELDARGWGVRTLAKRIDPANSEVPRRNLNRYLHEGKLPTGASRADIARGLGIPEADVPTAEKAESEDEDEEADQMVVDLFARAVAVALEQHMKKQSPPPDLAVATGTGSEPEGA